jgi:UDP-N-acetylglucosamine 2-epimerase (non-hydrolysing)
VFITGNTVIDALLWVRDKLNSKPDDFQHRIKGLGLHLEFAQQFLRTPVALPSPGSAATVDVGSKAEPAGAESGRRSPLILVTGHRRESFGQGLENLCLAIRQLVESHDDVGVIYPVHLNPQVQEPVRRILGNHPRIQLISPLGYEDFVWLMDQSFFILSDSGGVQEEAPSLGKPVLVMRDTTERPEGVAAGTCRLVGTDPEVILREANLLLTSKSEYRRRSGLTNPYGDGNAAQRIVGACARFLRNAVSTKE